MAHRDRAHRLSVMAMPIQVCFPMALTVAIELRVFEIIAEGGPRSQLFPSEIVTKMPTTNPNAATALERILQILVVNSLVTVQETNDGEGERTYGLMDQSRCLVSGDDGVSLATLVLFCLQKPTLDCFYHLGASVLEGGPTPFHRTHGMDLFEYATTDQKFRGLFHEAMSNVTVIILTEVLEGYKGFSEVKEMVDVGGGNGTSINLIVSKYPHIRAVNYDLPYVITGAPSYPSVEHIPGDMFESVPPTETIFMRPSIHASNPKIKALSCTQGILHNWGDDKCLKLLMNCWKALPDGGMVISVEFVIPPILGTDHVSRFTTSLDLLIMPMFIGGKERPASEYCDLAKAAGFFETKVFPISNGIAIMEFCKRL